MPDGEVKIHLRADGDSKKIEDMQKRIADLRRAAAAYDSNNKVDMGGAAKSARSEAAGIEREIARMTKARATEERAVTQQLKEQGALQKAGVGRSPISMRGLSSAGLGALAGEIFSTVVDQFAMAEQLGNRRTATAQGTERQLAITRSLRGTSAGAVSESYAAEDQAAQLRRERPQLETANKYNWINKAGEGAMWGAGIGAGIGSAVPVLGTALGAVAGGLIGGAIRGGPAYFQGQNAEKQSKQDEEQQKEKAKAMEELAPKQFMETEGGLQRDKLQQRSKRTLEGQRAVFVDEMAESWLKTYRDIYSRTKDSGISKEMADTTVQNELRDRQAAAGAGLVDARSGGAAISAAAQWATGAFPGMKEVSAQIQILNGTVERNQQEANRINQHKP